MVTLRSPSDLMSAMTRKPLKTKEIPQAKHPKWTASNSRSPQLGKTQHKAKNTNLRHRTSRVGRWKARSIATDRHRVLRVLYRPVLGKDVLA